MRPLLVAHAEGSRSPIRAKRPLGVLAQQVVVAACERLGQRRVGGAADVAERYERVPTQVARIVAGDIEPAVAPDQRRSVCLQPVDQRNRGLSVRGIVPAALLDAAVPGADLLADVAAVDHVRQRLPVGLRDRLGRLCPVGEAPVCVERARLVQRAGGAGVDAEAAVAAVELERRRRLDLDVGDERAQDDPRPVTASDQHGVLAVEADAGPYGALAVDVLVGVDQDAVRPAQPRAERIELLAELGVAVAPGVAGQAPLAGARRCRRRVVTERGGHDRPGARQQRLGVAGHLGLRHREAHVREQPAGAPFPDMQLGLRVRHGGRGSDRVDPELLGESVELDRRHDRIVTPGAPRQASAPRRPE